MVMETERTLRELLIVLKDNKQYFESGLCWLIIILRNNSIITNEEAKTLRIFINEHPTDYCKNSDLLFYFPIYEWKPREKWLNEWINKLETDNLK